MYRAFSPFANLSSYDSMIGKMIGDEEFEQKKDALRIEIEKRDKIKELLEAQNKTVNALSAALIEKMEETELGSL